MARTIWGAVWCAALAVVMCASTFHSPARAQHGGGRGGVDTIKVSKNMWVPQNGSMIVDAVSSNSNARLALFLASGRYVGELKNGSGGKYGGTVFFAGPNPGSITIKSTFGGIVTSQTQIFHP